MMHCTPNAFCDEVHRDYGNPRMCFFSNIFRYKTVKGSLNMIDKKIEVKKLPDGCMGHFIFGYSGCSYATIYPDTNNPGVYCRWDEKHENRILCVGGRPKDCPLVQKEIPTKSN